VVGDINKPKMGREKRGKPGKKRGRKMGYCFDREKGWGEHSF